MPWLDGIGVVSEAELADFDEVLGEQQAEDDMASWLAGQEAARAAEQLRISQDADEQDGGPRGSDENRLSRALQRIARAATYRRRASRTRSGTSCASQAG
jgi:hypothetical protein